MPDNVDITAGVGTTIGTDEVGGVHYQFVKLVDGTLGETAGIPGDATNGLDVDVTRLGRSFTKTNATGAAAISASKTASGDNRLVSVTVHLSSAPTTAGSLAITLNANAGAAYDTLLYTVSGVGLTDLLFQPDADLFLENADAVDVAYANPDGRTYGVQITFEVV